MDAKPITIEKAITPKQFAERFGCCVHTVLALIRSGELIAVNVGRKGGQRPRWRITPEAIEQFESLRSSSKGKPIRQPRRQKMQFSNCYDGTARTAQERKRMRDAFR